MVAEVPMQTREPFFGPGGAAWPRWSAGTERRVVMAIPCASLPGCYSDLLISLLQQAYHRRSPEEARRRDIDLNVRFKG